jgi:hypothetical protein
MFRIPRKRKSPFPPHKFGTIPYWNSIFHYSPFNNRDTYQKAGANCWEGLNQILALPNKVPVSFMFLFYGHK